MSPDQDCGGEKQPSAGADGGCHRRTQRTKQRSSIAEHADAGVHLRELVAGAID